MEKHVHFAQRDKVGYIVLSNPPGNRIGKQYAEQLRETIAEAGSSEVRCLVVRAEGDDFSLGGAMQELRDNKSSDRFRMLIAEVNSCYRTLESLRVPTVAEVRGRAFGGGFELALSCDFVVASESARFKCVEITGGNVPVAGGVQRLAERCGRVAATRVVMLGELVTAEQAEKLGFVTYVYPDTELASRVDELADRLASGPTLAYGATKALLKAWSIGGVVAADALLLDIAIRLFDSEDMRTGLAEKIRVLDTGSAEQEIVFQGK